MNKTFNWNNIKRNLKKNSPLIMTTLGIAGSVGAVVHAFRVAPKAKEVLKEIDEKFEGESKGKIFWEKTKAVAPMAIPVVIMEGTSIACAIGSYKVNSKRLAGLATAYALSERRFSDYREQVVKQIGEKKEQKVRDAVAEEKVKKAPIGQGNEVVLLDNEQLCYDAYSGRYFKSTIDKMQKAENELNKRLQTEMYISLNELYYELGLPETGVGEEVGWNIGEDLISLEFTSTLLDNNQTCVVVDYRVGPQFDYRNLH